jgi:hypothetical protein
MSGQPVIVFAFDPVEELGGVRGLLVLSAELAGRLIAEHRVESAAAHFGSPLRFVVGSEAHRQAGQALRELREQATQGPRARKVARLVDR